MLDMAIYVWKAVATYCDALRIDPSRASNTPTEAKLEGIQPGIKVDNTLHRKGIGTGATFNRWRTRYIAAGSSLSVLHRHADFIIVSTGSTSG